MRSGPVPVPTNLWYWPPLDSAGLHSSFLPFSAPRSTHPLFFSLSSTLAPLWLEFLTWPKPRPFPTQTSSQCFRRCGLREWFLVCTSQKCHSLACCSMSRIVLACPPAFLTASLSPSLRRVSDARPTDSAGADVPNLAHSSSTLRSVTTPLHSPLVNTNYERFAVHGGEALMGHSAKALTIPPRRSLIRPTRPRYPVIKYRSP